ncbi:N-acetyllactosaminide beta-1,6-N-acetylglucosaminyl-transferase-like [Glandiceps talaboti]
MKSLLDERHLTNRNTHTVEALRIEAPLVKVNESNTNDDHQPQRSRTLFDDNMQIKGTSKFGHDQITNVPSSINSTPIIDNRLCSDIINQAENISSDRIAINTNLLMDDIKPDKTFIMLASNCSEFVHTRGYVSKPVTIEEIDFPLAFTILMYKSVHQVEQLLRTIYRPHNIYCIHVDKKAPPEVHIAIQAISTCFHNVFIASRLANVVWGSISTVYAERYCQEDLLAKHQKWKYLINLTGQEFPLKTNLEMVQILKEFRGRNDIITSEKPVPMRVQYRHYVQNGKVVETEMKKTEPLPNNITIHKGELHCALARPFIEFLHRSDVAKEFILWLTDTRIPDEAFYQSLAALPDAPGGPSHRISLSQVSRSKLWSPSTECKGKNVRNICVYSWKDLHRIVKQPQMFINKIFLTYDPLVLHCLEGWITRRIVKPINLNLDLYRRFEEKRSWKDIQGNEEWIV